MPGRQGPGRRRGPARAAQSARARPWWRRLLVPLAATLLAAWAATCVVTGAPWDWLDVGVVSAATLAPFTAVGAVAVATAALRNRRWPSAAVAVLAGLFPWVFVLGYAAPSDTTAAPGALAIRAMMVTAHDGVADADGIVRAVRDHQVQLLVVTELSGTLAHDLTTAGIDRLLTPQWVSVPGPPQAGIGIWSRLEVAGLTAVAGTTWPAVTARIGGRFTLITGHVVPPVPDDARRWRSDLAAFDQAARAAAQPGSNAASGAVVLLANLNATPWHPAFRALVGHGLADAADVLGRGLRSTWPTWSPLPLTPLDHALVSATIVVQSVDAIPIAATDHRALLVSLLA